MNIKFNHLLFVSLVLVVVGYIVQSALSVRALNHANSSYALVAETLSFSSWLDSIKTEALELEREFARLSPDSSATVKNLLAQNAQNIETQQPQDLVDIDLLSDVIATAKDYNDLLLNRLRLAEEVGFSKTSGLTLQLETVEKTFNESAILGFTIFQAEKAALVKAQRNLVLEPNTENLQQNQLAFDAFMAKIKDFDLEAEPQALANDYFEITEKYSIKAIELIQTEQESYHFSNTLSDKLAKVILTINQYKDQLRNKTELETKNTLVFLTVSTLFICLLVSIVMGRVIRKIVRSLGKAQQELALLEQGDLTRRQKFNSKRFDAIDQVASSMDKMAVNLSNVVSNVQNTSSELNTIVDEVNGLIQKTSESNQDNMLKVSSLTASTEEISLTMNDISKNTAMVNESSDEAATESHQGTKLVSEVCDKVGIALSGMDTIKQSITQLTNKSSEIDAVIDLINDIANQTNLLALNAAIEAARAGEAGRGFSVVADEVRTLAESTVSATSKITDTIRAFQSETGKAGDAVEKGESTLKLISDGSSTALEGIRKVEALVIHNSDSTGQMAFAITEIAKTISAMSKDTETIAQGLEEDNKSVKMLVNYSQSIQEKSAQLDKMMSKFKAS